MSFGYSVSEVVLITELAWRTFQNSRKACGEYDELTREVSSCHAVLGRLERELEDSESLLSKENDDEELGIIVHGSEKVLKVLDIILGKFNTLSDEERSKRRLWQKICFGNGKVEDVRDQRARLTYHTQALSLYINLHTTASVGRVEKQMKESGGDLKEIRLAVNHITAHLLSVDSNKRDGSILSTYSNDDKAIWREFRRELVRDGFRSSVIQEHKEVIKAYIKELGSRGFLDEVEPVPPGEACPSTPRNDDFDFHSLSEGGTEDVHVASPGSALLVEQASSRILARESGVSEDVVRSVPILAESESSDENFDEIGYNPKELIWIEGQVRRSRSRVSRIQGLDAAPAQKAAPSMNSMRTRSMFALSTYLGR